MEVKQSSSTVAPVLSISIVSHNQMQLVRPLLDDISRIFQTGTTIEVLLTLNVAEPLGYKESDFPFALHLIRNRHPRGFGANHNHAFRQMRGAFFCVLNPDIRITDNPFPALLAALESDASMGLAAPCIHNSGGQLEDSARKFPSPWRIAHRVLTRRRKRDYVAPSTALHPDWVAGMFMLLRTPVYQQLRGFDERYFLYYEDVDLCARIRLAGLDIVQLPLPGVVHDAQRASHRDPKYLRWHVGSMLRFFCSGVFMRLQWRQITGRGEA